MFQKMEVSQTKASLKLQMPYGDLSVQLPVHCVRPQMPISFTLLTTMLFQSTVTVFINHVLDHFGDAESHFLALKCENGFSVPRVKS